MARQGQAIGKKRGPGPRGLSPVEERGRRVGGGAGSGASRRVVTEVRSGIKLARGGAGTGGYRHK